MAETNEKVMALVAAAIKRSPDATTSELQAAAAKKFPSIGKLSRRQFNARYPLQIKRKLPTAKRASAKKTVARKKAAATKAPARSGARQTARRAAAAVASAGRGRTRKAESSAADRDAIRQQFLRFASDITAAEGRHDLVKVLAGVDRYVDAVVKAAR